MYQKQYEADVWDCYNFELIFIAFWNILKLENGLKNKGLINSVGEGGDGGYRNLYISVSFVDAVLETT